uniref:C3H1-type domain-containing protein n=1 Tax=Glossina brevipalpis TaxID=37001 RepID=A0A1A9VZM0_9MUSC
MGGKSYYCDYCQCYMKNDLNVRKVHNSGLSHKIAKVTYMKRYENPIKVYEEESAKKPCSRYHKGYCKFGLYCQFSHYNESQLKLLEIIVQRLKSKCEKQKKSSLKKYLPWLKRNSKDGHPAPHLQLRSTEKMNLYKLLKVDFGKSKWGLQSDLK